jgi:hypothetical protein
MIAGVGGGKGIILSSFLISDVSVEASLIGNVSEDTEYEVVLKFVWEDPLLEGKTPTNWGLRSERGYDDSGVNTFVVT